MHVLFLGNGFDLYHGLKTSYKDFLLILQNITEFNNAISRFIDNKNTQDNDSHIFDEIFLDESLEGSSVHKIYELLKDNSWANYYANCNADIQGWIDFENEMLPAIKLMKEVFCKDVRIVWCTEADWEASITFDSYKERAMMSLWPEFFDERDEYSYIIRTPYFDANYGILKAKIIKKMEDDLDDFITAFTLYLKEFVERRDIEKYKWINSINPNRIISFNYTSTERNYFEKISDSSCAHIHGSTIYSNIVFGTDLIDDDDSDFVNFSKRFQRLFKVGDYSYLDYITESDDFASITDANHYEPLTVSFIGCSLDKNDSSIFRSYIEKADKINVYCYGFSGYKSAMGNLINIFGHDRIRDYLHCDENGVKLNFIDIKDLSINDDTTIICAREYYKDSNK